MLARLRSHLSYANVMATIAVFIALGGSSYAALRVTGKNVPKNALTGADIKNLTGKDVRNNSLTGADVRNLTSADVANGRLLAEDFAPGQLPAGSRGEPGAKGDKGDSGATNVTTRRGALATIDPDANVTVTVDCDPGEVATGGGIEIRNGSINDMVAWGSVPLPTDTSTDLEPKGWLVRARNEDANNDNMGTIQVRAEAVCASP